MENVNETYLIYQNTFMPYIWIQARMANLCLP